MISPRPSAVTTGRAPSGASLALLGLWLVACAVSSTPAPAAATNADCPGDGSRVVRQLDGSVHIAGHCPVATSALVLEIGALLGAEVTVAPDLGMIQPGEIAPGPPREVLMAIARHRTLVILEREGQITRVIALDPGHGEAPRAPLVREAVAGNDADGTTSSAHIREIVKLGYDGGPEAIRDLELVYQSSDDPAVRSAAVGALASIRGAGALGIVEQALDDPSPKVRVAAAYGLSLIRGTRAEPRLRAMLETDPSPEVRVALGRLFGTEDSEAPSSTEER